MYIVGEKTGSDTRNSAIESSGNGNAPKLSKKKVDEILTSVGVVPPRREIGIIKNVGITIFLSCKNYICCVHIIE